MVGLFDLSLFIIFVKSWTNFAGTYFGCFYISKYSILCSSSCMLVAGNGSSPSHTISYRITPRAHISDSLLYSQSVHISGQKYRGVPTFDSLSYSFICLLKFYFLDFDF